MKFLSPVLGGIWIEFLLTSALAEARTVIGLDLDFTERAPRGWRTGLKKSFSALRGSFIFRLRCGNFTGPGPRLFLMGATWGLTCVPAIVVNLGL